MGRTKASPDFLNPIILLQSAGCRVTVQTRDWGRSLPSPSGHWGVAGVPLPRAHPQGAHLGGRDPKGLGDLGVELADVGEALDLARGAAVGQLRAEDEARAHTGRCGAGGRRGGRGRARGFGSRGLPGRCALHGWVQGGGKLGHRVTEASAAAAAAGSTASCSLPSPGPGCDRRVRGSENPSRPWKVTPRGAGEEGGRAQVSAPCQAQLHSPSGQHCQQGRRTSVGGEL